MVSICDMISHNLIKLGDTVSFTFKGNKFNSKILQGGLLGQCTIQRAHDSEHTPILSQTCAFSSLTAWTEACLQDIMDEYYTRYSSWKRVIHQESKRSMGDIRDQCKLMDPVKQKNDTTELYKEIIRLHGTIDEMNLYIESICPGQAKQWSYLNISAQKEQIVPINVGEHIDTAVHSKIQDIVCNGGTGIINYLN